MHNQPYHRQIKIGPVSTSEAELKDLIKAWIAISIAFGILLSGASIFSAKFYSSFVVASLSVGIGFIFHEMGHKLMAQRYGCFAEFRSSNLMLLLAVMMSFLGFVIAAPGAVMIAGPVGKRRNGKISAVGPAMNIAVALLFLAILLIPPTGILKQIAYYGFLINTWLALFNMLPLWNFDGKKILQWNKIVYAVMILIALSLMLLQGFLFS